MFTITIKIKDKNVFDEFSEILNQSEEVTENVMITDNSFCCEINKTAKELDKEFDK